MIGSARERKLHYVTVDFLPLRNVLLASFLAVGVFLGYVFSNRFQAESGGELRRYLESFLSLSAQRTVSLRVAAQTAVCYFRASVPAFLLGFASIGVVALPLLFAAQGFLLSFSMFCFASVVGKSGFAILPALFAIRLLFVLPCTFVLGSAAFDKSYDLAALMHGGGKRVRGVVYGSAYWYRFALCCVCLSIGCALELWLEPMLLSLC